MLFYLHPDKELSLLENKEVIRRICSTLVVAVFDILIIGFSLGISFLVRFDFLFSSIPQQLFDEVIQFAPVYMLITVLFLAVFGTYSFVWNFVSISALARIIPAVILSWACGYFYMFFINVRLPVSVYFMSLLINLLMITALRYSYRVLRYYIDFLENRGAVGINTMIIGAGEAGRMLAVEYSHNKKSCVKVRCFIDDNTGKKSRMLEGIPIVGGRDKIAAAVKRYDIKQIIYAIPSSSEATKKEILEICKSTGCVLKTIPGLSQLLDDSVKPEMLREVQLEDLLGREPIKVNTAEILNELCGKVIMVTGGGGSIGSELCRQIAAHNPKKLVIVDIYENGVYDLQNELLRKYPKLDLHVLIASVRDSARINHIMAECQPEIVYHAAAHKHVPLMEDSPNEAVKNNVFGTYNTAKAASDYGVGKFVLISTDKAVNPTSIMGATKRICEMIIQMMSRHSKTEFAAVRFGNVLGSNGSVVPLFKKQIEYGGPVTVTHPDIVRYFMLINEAVSLVLQAGAYARGGEIFILDMGEPIKIDTLARTLIQLSGHTPDVDIKIKYTGLRPGEKLYEEKLMDEEGLQKTENNMIHIAKPIEMDEKRFSRQLLDLKAACESNSPDIEKLVARTVTTYKPEETVIKLIKPEKSMLQLKHN
jgi:FlaA1/EpsC-like NDP-sugar epimerase